MGLLGLLLSAYFILLLVRALVPDTGQMAFNQPYRLAARLTEPVISFSARLLPLRFRRLAALPAIGFLILLHGVVLTGASGPQAGAFDWGFVRWVFIPAQPFWGLGKSLAHYLVLSYRVFAFLFLVVLVSPEISSDQVSRLIRTLVQPLTRALRGRGTAAAALPLIFTAAMFLLWRFFGAVGWVGAEGMMIGKTLVNSLVLVLRLATVIIYLIFFRAVLSWFEASRRWTGPFAWLELFVEPFLRPFWRFKLILSRIDLSPLAAIFTIWVGRKFAENILFEIYQAL